MPPSWAHFLASAGLRCAGAFDLPQNILRGIYSYDHPLLHQKIAGINFPNPVGLAAGFDKSGTLAEPLSCFGFGFLEAGTVTLRHWRGNEKQLLLRLARKEALINSIGLRNAGAKEVLCNIELSKLPIPIGLSIAQTPDLSFDEEKAACDLVETIMYVYSIGPSLSYITLDISCANVFGGKLFQNPKQLSKLLYKLRSYRGDFELPIFAKISRELDRSQLSELIDVFNEFRIAGVIAGNTKYIVGKGGLSGKPLLASTRELVGALYRIIQEKASSVKIIACGGISTADEALDLFFHGATLIQLYTGLVYEGPGLPSTINRGLVERLQELDATSITQVVGRYYR